MNILLAEDDSRAAAFFQRVLETSGYEVELATSGDVALSLAVQRSYDALIADMSLPLVDGCTLVEAVRAQRVWIPVLLVATGTPRQQLLDGEDGHTRLLPKPCTARDLLTALATVLRNSARMRALQRS